MYTWFVFCKVYIYTLVDISWVNTLVTHVEVYLSSSSSLSSWVYCHLLTSFVLEANPLNYS